MENEANSLISSRFIEEWLNHFNLMYEKDVIISRTKKQLDYLIHESGQGILISNWKKPLSIKMINLAVHIVEEFNLKELILVADKISEHAYDTISRLKLEISIIHPHGLSELAMKFVGINRKSPLEIAQ